MFILFFISCSKELGQVEQIKRSVERYNQLLIEGYKNLNMNPLQEVATPEQATKAYHHMAAFGEADIKIISELKKIEFLVVKLTGSDKAVVKTREVWDFKHVDIKTSTKKMEEKDFIYRITYELEKNNNKWLVSSVIAEDEKDIKK